MSDKSLLAIPLGGLGEFGMNMLALRYGDDIIVIDSGMMFPEAELLGVDIVVPDISYLIENRKLVRGIVLTHGHEDHIGALPYFLKKFNLPVYASRFTLADDVDNGNSANAPVPLLSVMPHTTTTTTTSTTTIEPTRDEISLSLFGDAGGSTLPLALPSSMWPRTT